MPCTGTVAIYHRPNGAIQPIRPLRLSALSAAPRELSHATPQPKSPAPSITYRPNPKEPANPHAKSVGEMATTFPYYLLPGEDRDEYESLADAYDQEFKPATEHELFLVNQLLESRWKVHRFERLIAEAANQLFAAGEVKNLSTDAALVDALAQPGSAYEKLHRFLAQAERSYQRTWNLLTQAQRQRAKARTEALDARLDDIMNAPLPKPPIEQRRNEPNPEPLDPETSPEPAILDSPWHEPGSQSR